MDLLWADTGDYGITPLLGCVPRLRTLIYSDDRQVGAGYSQGSFLSHKAPNDSVLITFEVVEPLSEHEARQFLRHAIRVRSFNLCISSIEHFHLLTSLAIGTCVFPRLLALQVFCGSGNSPRNIEYWQSHLILSPVLRRCFHVLESLFIGYSTVRTTDGLLLLSETIRSCKQLKHLKCTPLDYAAWKHLSNLPTLDTVTIHEGAYNVCLDRYNVIFAPFLRVTILYFGLATAVDIITVMQHSEFPSLKVFQVDVCVLHRVEAEQLLHAMFKCGAYQTLEHIDIHTRKSLESRDPSLPTLTRQFLHFTRLQTLSLSLGCPMYLDNHLFLEAMSSWPHIYDLSLSNTHLVTFRGLFAALRLRPRLHSLATDIDAVNIDIDPEIESFQHTSLQRLDVGSSHVGDPVAVARIIFMMLPCIRCVIRDSNRPEWDEVNRQLDSLRLSVVV
jgi:hypothetical protein